MRKAPQRSFTVEAKASGRRSSTIIPTRVTTPPAPAPKTVFSSPTVAREPAAEKRRILPSLIVPEVPEIEAALLTATEEAPLRRRGRPRKHPLPVEAPKPPRVDAAAISEPAITLSPEPAALLSAPAPRKRKELASAKLPRGERWKIRRLGRWSR